LHVTTEDGTPLFCGKDVASILGYKDTTNALKLHCKGVVKHHPLETPGGIQQVRFITEPDLYRLITHSKLPEAEKFERWVFEEVLPSIRKRGGYLTPEATREALRDPDFIIQLAMDLKEERAARAKAEAEVEALLTPSAFGKILSKTHKDMGPNKFCRWLLNNNFAFRNGQGKIIPMQDAVNRGILILTERIDPAGKIRPQLLVTPAGQSYFAGILSA